MKYFIFDLDDTLLNNNKEVTDYTLKGINILKNNDFIIVINTARSFSATLDVANIIKPDYLIVIEDKKFVVASEVKVKEELFGYLVNIDNNEDVMFARIDSDDSISEIQDDRLIEALIPLLLENQDLFKAE